jgi:DNA polymerase-3 subunit epsilon
MIDLAMRGDARALLAAVDARMQPHIGAGRFERAQEWRDRLEAALLGIERAGTLAAMVTAGRVSAGRLEGRRWHLHIVDEGRLVAAGVVEPGRDPREVLSALEATAEVCPPALRDPIPRPIGLIEESRLLWSWLTEPGTRLIHASHPLAFPVHSGGQMLTTVRAARGVSR